MRVEQKHRQTVLSNGSTVTVDHVQAQVPPMLHAVRAAAYVAQNAGRRVTVAQARQLRKVEKRAVTRAVMAQWPGRQS